MKKYKKLYNKLLMIFKTRFYRIATISILIVIIFGIYGYLQDGNSFLDSIYYTIKLFLYQLNIKNDTNFAIEIAKWLAVLVTGFTFIKVIYFIAKEEITEFLIKKYQNHYIFCGINDHIVMLINDLIKTNTKVVIIDQKQNIDKFINNQIRNNINIIYGDFLDEFILNKGNILQADYLFAITEDDELNLKLIEVIQKMFNKNNTNHHSHYASKKRQGQKLNIRIHIQDITKYNLFKEFFNSEITCLDFHVINFHRIAAQNIIDEYSPDKIVSIDPFNKESIHILISGFDIQGEHFLFESAQIYHFANRTKLKVTIVDENINKKFELFKTKVNNIMKVVDIELIDILDISNNVSSFYNISVCFISHEEDSVNLKMVQFYKQLFLSLNNNIKQPKMIVLLTKNSSIYNTLNEIKSLIYKTDITVKQLYIDYINVNTLIHKKERCDELAYYFDLIYEENIENYISNDPLPNWNRKTEFMKDWNRYPARHIEIKLRALDYELSKNKTNKDTKLIITSNFTQILAEMEHRRWNAEKWLTGFIPSNNMFIENNEKIFRLLKIHSDLIDWNLLNENEKNKDEFVINNIQVILSHLKNNNN